VNSATRLAALPPEQSGEIAGIGSKRSQFKDLIAICTGTKNVTREEFGAVLYIPFNLIVASRMGELLNGKFLTSATETRLATVENNVNELVDGSHTTGRLVRRILNHLEGIDPFGKCNND
jgi:hypothetical protein